MKNKMVIWVVFCVGLMGLVVAMDAQDKRSKRIAKMTSHTDVWQVEQVSAHPEMLIRLGDSSQWGFAVIVPKARAEVADAMAKFTRLDVSCGTPEYKAAISNLAMKGIFVEVVAR